MLSSASTAAQERCPPNYLSNLLGLLRRSIHSPHFHSICDPFMKARLLSILLCLCGLLLAACNSEKQTGPGTGPASADLDAPNPPTGYTAQYQEQLAKVNAQCPQTYPEVVTPLPDAHELADMDAGSLIGMLDSWNPVLRMEAAKALGAGSADVIPELRRGTHSENDKVRAGSATALAALCKSLPAGELPPDLADDFIRLSTDEEHEVRVAALKALSTLEPKTPATTLAVLAMCTDPNEYLAQDAKVALNKFFTAYELPMEDIEAGLKAAMGGPLPNGKGHIVQIISKLKPGDRKRFTPVLLEHVAWFPDRDTMFAAGGQQQAIEMLTTFGETRVLEYLPDAMGKISRGEGLFNVCLDAMAAFGADAKVLLPRLKEIRAELAAKGQEAAIRPNRDIEAGLAKLEQTIKQIESL